MQAIKPRRLPSGGERANKRGESAEHATAAGRGYAARNAPRRKSQNN